MHRTPSLRFVCSPSETISRSEGSREGWLDDEVSLWVQPRLSQRSHLFYEPNFCFSRPFFQGTVLCYKLGGALADQGGDIDAVYKVAQFVADRTATIGSGLDHTHIPGTGPSESHLKADQLEVGMGESSLSFSSRSSSRTRLTLLSASLRVPGIHNEPGLETVPLTTTKDLLVKMINLATDTTDKDRSFVPFQNDGKDEIVLMVNNLGGSSSVSEVLFVLLS